MRLSPADRFINHLKKIFESEHAKSAVLLAMVVIAMIWANSPFKALYHDIFATKFELKLGGAAIKESIHVWINDGLIAIFFFAVGLEIKREIIEGQLSSLKKASLPIVGALGGMLLPAVIFYALNYQSEFAHGWAIPMATDIAFTLGILGLFSKHISKQTQVFLMALSTADDLGAILVIALFLAPNVVLINLLIAAAIYAFLELANRLGVRNMWFYTIVGVFALWPVLLFSGVHATLAGVIVAFTIPARRKIKEDEYEQKINKKVNEFNAKCTNKNELLTEEQNKIIRQIVRDSKNVSSPLQRVEAKITPAVHFVILPLFALANAGITFNENPLKVIVHPLSLSIIAALALGKLMGIFGSTFFASKALKIELPTNQSKLELATASMFAGIGFTMSIFIAEIVFTNPHWLAIAKVGIISASLLSVVMGWFLVFITKSQTRKMR